MTESGVARRRFDCRIAVIGDIHGCSGALRRLLREIGEMPILVAGDVGDRGLDTRGVIEQLVERGAEGVLGNHDEWLLRWAEGGGFDSFALNRIVGGAQTLRSYGVVGQTPREVEAQRRRVPAEHRQWLNGLVRAIDLRVCNERYWLVHAGVDGSNAPAGLPLDQVVPWLAVNAPQTLMWNATAPEAIEPLDRTVLMGHVPRAEPMDLGHVIALDTGAGLSDGQLSAVVLPDRRFVSVPARC